ncbi:MAG: hypothetical protein ACRC1K_23465 [Planctomycetia bacterium]
MNAHVGADVDEAAVYTVAVRGANGVNVVSANCQYDKTGAAAQLCELWLAVQRLAPNPRCIRPDEPARGAESP